MVLLPVGKKVGRLSRKVINLEPLKMCDVCSVDSSRRYECRRRHLKVVVNMYDLSLM